MKAILVTLACIIGLTHAKITYENCLKKGNEALAEVRHFEVSPDPPSFSKNVTVTLDAELFKDMPENLMIKMNIYKVTGIFGIPIPAPCLLGVGSCTTPYCTFFERFKEQACPFFPGDTCDCDIKAGLYGGNQKITIVPPNLGPLIKFVASGNFRIELRFVDKDTKKESLCYVFKGKALP
ncbi:hypothetical protein AVEN_199769-1 [Araneus ventricosus]|uniref:MD-2-related lipid-recognition domain-containing protein n=1 Tax=Araneus ventricosus TaxID=182803 RepID=A0A4Y2GBH7_ARAVE|nr:hypothetical protein AVEN_199769-1 [Araneus ventricosus]